MLIFLMAANASGLDFSFNVRAAGDGVFHANEEATLTLLIEPEVEGGLNLTLANSSELILLMTTAKDVRVELDSIDVVKVRNVDSVIIGDIPAGKVATASFRISVGDFYGEVSIPFTIYFTKAEVSPSGSGVQISFKEERYSDSVKIKIEKKLYDFSVRSVSSSLKAGNFGTVEVEIENTGEKEIKEAYATLNSSFFTVLNSVFIGNLKPNERINVTFRVIAPEATGNYPARITLFFKDSTEQALSRTVNLSVEEASCIHFEKIAELVPPAKSFRVENSPIFMPSRGFISFKLVSDCNINDAYAILVFENPLIRAENSPYVGNSKEAVLTFYINSSAFEGEYLGYIYLKYRNEFGDTVVSEKSYFSVKVREPQIIRDVKLNAGIGSDGDLELEFDDNFKSLEVSLLSPERGIIVLSPSAYVPDGSNAVFKIKVSEDVSSGYHVLYALIRFEKDDAKDLFYVEKVPVLLLKSNNFAILSVKSELYPDATGEVVVEFRNLGNAISNAVAYLQVSAPFSPVGVSAIGSLVSQAQTANYFIGNVGQNDVAVAKFRVSVDKDAGEGSYPATFYISYYDENGYKHTSSTMTISLEVKKPAPYALYASILIASIGVILAITFARRRRHGKRQG